MNLGVFFAAAMLMLLTFLVFREIRQEAEKTKEEIRKKVFNTMARKHLILYAVGVFLYVSGLAVALPFAFMAASLDFPKIFRFESNVAVLYSTFRLDSKGFLIYWFLLPLFMLVSVYGLNIFEKNAKVIREIDKQLRETTGEDPAG